MEGREAPSRPPNPALPYREDCWSEGETSALVDAWGDHYIELNRGNLRQKHWQEVADAVNSRRGAGRRPARTDVQCKNRIDTLKKKYKVEKARVGAGVSESEWPFFSRLEFLIGSAPPPPAKKSPALPPVALPPPAQRKRSALSAVVALRADEPKKKRVSAVAFPVDDQIFRRAAAAAAAAAEEDEEEGEVGSGSISLSRSLSRSKKGTKKGRKGEGDGIRDLARAIMRFAEIYESVEEAKQRQMFDLEKQRMEFAKALEFQKLQMFVDTQVQLAKIKRVKRSYTGECFH